MQPFYFWCVILVYEGENPMKRTPPVLFLLPNLTGVRYESKFVVERQADSPKQAVCVAV